MNKCPHCDGEIREIDNLTWHFNCRRCGRGWCVQPNGDWHSRFSAGREVYSSKGVYLGEWKTTIDKEMIFTKETEQ